MQKHITPTDVNVRTTTFDWLALKLEFRYYEQNPTNIKVKDTKDRNKSTRRYES